MRLKISFRMDGKEQFFASSKSIKYVLLLSLCNNLFESPKECGYAFAVEATESSLLQVNMKTTDLSKLLEFFAFEYLEMIKPRLKKLKSQACQVA